MGKKTLGAAHIAPDSPIENQLPPAIGHWKSAIPESFIRRSVGVVAGRLLFGGRILFALDAGL